MIGGYQILDLRGIDLQISGSASNITDPYVLKQLLSLRDHIDKAYDFNKLLVNQLKPVLIRFRDKKNGEKTEGSTFGEMSVVGNYYTFKITGRISGQFTVIINVAFHEVTNAYGNKEWLINTAKIQLADASNVLEGDIAIDGDLSVSGSINGEQNPSVKPIYCHPVYLVYDDDNATIWLNWLIFNNDPTAFTFATLKAYFRDLMDNFGARFMTTGGQSDKSDSSYNTAIITEDRGSDQTGVFLSNGGYITLENLDPTKLLAFQDGVNKIN